MVAQPNRLRIHTLVLLVTVASSLLPVRMMHASGPDETALDSLALIQMEHRVEMADQREQCYLYAEVLHGFTELVGRQIAANQFEEASATILRMDAVAMKLQAASVRDAKRLKNVEQLLEHTTHRFHDLVRAASAEDRVAMQKTLQHLDALHTEVLAKVFSR